MANAPADPKLPILQRDHRSVMGKVLYTSKKPERMNQERGREYFRIDVHADGTRTCTAHCEIDDRPSVMRDITYSLDKDWMPTDCFVRLSVGSRFMGSGWFRFHPQYAECETYTSMEGRVSQTMDLATPLVTFQNHAIACDAWHLRLIDQRKPGEVQRIKQMLLSSPIIAAPPAQCCSPSGSTSCLLARRSSRWVQAPSMRCISSSSPTRNCPRSTRRTTSGARRMGITCSSRARSPATCKPTMNWWSCRGGHTGVTDRSVEL